jgi:hypothetical protein
MRLYAESSQHSLKGFNESLYPALIFILTFFQDAFGIVFGIVVKCLAPVGRGNYFRNDEMGPAFKEPTIAFD